MADPLEDRKSEIIQALIHARHGLHLVHGAIARFPDEAESWTVDNSYEIREVNRALELMGSIRNHRCWSSRSPMSSHQKSDEPYRCLNCMDQRWVCEDHPHVPWDEGEGCCGGAGIPCPMCNTERPPANPPGFQVIAEVVKDA